MNFAYKTVYSDRKTISVSVSSRNEVTVRCPKSAGKERIERFLDEKSGWIERHFERNAKKLEENADILSYDNIMICGDRRKLVLGGDNYITATEVHARSVKSLKKLLVTGLGDGFLRRACKIAKDSALKPRAVNFRDYKARWGCCYADGKISFNYKLLMLPELAQAYVIVHELCHLKQRDHSEKFYMSVAEVMPEYKIAERELKKYDFICRLY